MPGRKDSIKIAITVQLGDEIMTVTDKRVLQLSGDRRRWKKQIAERVEEMAVLMGTRFAPDPKTDAHGPIYPAPKP